MLDMTVDVGWASSPNFVGGYPAIGQLPGSQSLQVLVGDAHIYTTSRDLLTVLFRKERVSCHLTQTIL